MLTSLERVDVSFAGSKEEQRIAAELFKALTWHGRFMSADAPVRVSVASASELLSRNGKGATPSQIEAAVGSNSSIFSIEAVGDEHLVVTTRSGQAATARTVDVTHTFPQRFLTPLPKPTQPVQPVRERPRIDPSWATLEQLLGPLDLEEFGSGEDLEVDATAEETDVPAVELAPEPIPEAEVEQASARTFTVPVAPVADVTGVDDVELASVVADRMRSDIRVANFGDQWMIEDRVPRFSRGDLRRFKDYIQEQEQPLTDDMLVQDVLGVRPGSPDFDVVRFAANFRLSREHREFDFVGTTNQRFWSTSNLPQIGTTRRKPNEIGTDYRFLLDELPESPAYRSLPSVDHVLTFYEYHLGLLPYDQELQQLLPAPLLPNQRSAVLTFECPQSYTTYLVELRYPTPNRGGFILGLDDFFSESLVPGALITIARTDNDGHYRVEYLAAGNQNGRLLEIEDRRQRYVFRPTTYSCAVADEFLLNEERFPRLASEKPLDEKVRRRPEAVVAATFERIGQENDGHGFWASFEDLLAATNVERPFSATYLRSILDQDESGAFARDPDGSDAYTYVPGNPA